MNALVRSLPSRDRVGWRRLLLPLLMLFATGCSTKAEHLPFVDLSERQALPPVERETVRPLRVAIAAVISPQGTAEGYRPLVDHVSETLERPVDIVQRRSYAEINDLVRRGEVDLAFVCTSAYVIGEREFGMRLLAVPQVDGETVYHSLLIVPVDSAARGMADLRGSTFAFTDPWSTSGRLAPTSLVQALGESPDLFFEKVIFTYSHDDAIRAVADGVADGAAVDSLVYRFFERRDPTLVARTKVIHESAPFAAPPVVTSPTLRPQVRAEIERLLLGLHESEVGRAALEAIGAERFVPVADEAYDSVRDLEASVDLGELP